jgi:hypothetical protein
MLPSPAKSESVTARAGATHHLAGLGWMLLAQLYFAGMNVSARLAGGDLPWPEVAAARFLVGVLLALVRRTGNRERNFSGPRSLFPRSICPSLC